MKIYRFVARAGKQKKMHGIFKGLDFEKANIPDGEFEELMSFIKAIDNIFRIRTKLYQRMGYLYGRNNGK